MPKLKLLAYRDYAGVDRNDPLRFYYWPIIGTMYRRRVELCLAQCSGGERILEAGFGSGVTFLNLNEDYKEIYGLDVSASVEEVAFVFKTKQIETHLQNGSVLSMPYEDDFFDTVLLISILEHLKPSEQIPAFQEIHRVLKPGGQAIYGVPSGAIATQGSFESPLLSLIPPPLAELSPTSSQVLPLQRSR